MVEIKNQLSTKQRILIGSACIGAFVTVTIIFFIIFYDANVERTASTVMSVISGLIVVWIILSLSGILREFSIKSPLFEMESKLERKIDDGNKEVCGKINNLNQNIQSVNQRIDTVVTNISNISSKAEINYYAYKHELDHSLNEVGVSTDKVEPSKSVPKSSQFEINSLLKRLEKLEFLNEISPSSYDIMRRANYYFYASQYDKAIELYDLILQIESENTQALFNKGYSYFMLRDYKNAIVNFEKVLEKDKDDTNAMFNIALSYRQIFNDVKATEYAKKVLGHKPNTPFEILQKGKASVIAGDYKKALEYCDEAERLGIKSKELVYTRACIYAMMEDVDTSIKFLKQVLDDPKFRALIKNDRDFEKIRNHPKFKELIN